MALIYHPKNCTLVAPRKVLGVSGGVYAAKRIIEFSTMTAAADSNAPDWPVSRYIIFCKKSATLQSDILSKFFLTTCYKFQKLGCISC